MRSTTRMLALALIVATAAALPSGALARKGADDRPGDDRGGSGTSQGQRVSGRCSGRSIAKLVVKPDDRRLEVEFEVDQNRAGVRWTVTLRRNAQLAVRTRAVTRGPSGSFSVERRLPDGRGRDRIAARATSPAGEVCSAALTI